MTPETLITLAAGTIGSAVVMLSQVPPVPEAIPWTSLLGQGGVIVAMGIGLRYTTLRQREAETAQNVARDLHIASVKTIYEAHNTQLTRLLQEEKEEAKVDRELFRSAINTFTEALAKLDK